MKLGVGLPVKEESCYWCPALSAVFLPHSHVGVFVSLGVAHLSSRVDARLCEICPFSGPKSLTVDPLLHQDAAS